MSQGDTPRSGGRVNVALAVALLLVSGVAVWLWLSRPSSPPPPPSSAPPSAPTTRVLDADVSDAADVTASAPDVAPTRAPEEPEHQFAIEGLVSDNTGRAIVGAKLEVIGEAGIITTIHSELDGSFRTGGLPLDLYEVRARASGFDQTIARRVTPGGPSLKLVLARGEALRGRVFTLDGAPAVGASVHVGGPGLFPQRFVTTDADGQFEVRGLRQGSYQYVVLTEKEGSHFPLRAEIGPTSPPVEVRLMPGYDLEAIISGEGHGVEGGLVTLSSEPLHVLALHETSDASGRARFTGLSAGTYYLGVRAPGFLPPPAQKITLPAPVGVEVRLDPGARVKGKVISAEDGTPVALAEVTAHVETPQGAVWRIDGDNAGVAQGLVRPDGSALAASPSPFISDTSGAFEVSGMPAGLVRLEARKDGWIPEQMVTFTLESTGIIDGVSLKLSRGTTASGRVLSAGDVPVEGARVRWRLAGEALPWRGETVSNARGAFHFDAIASEVVIEALSTNHEPFVDTFRLDPAKGPYEALTLRLQSTEGAILGRLLDSQRGPLAGATVRPVDAADASRCQGEGDARGVFRLHECGQRVRVFELRGPSAAPAWAELRASDEVELQLVEGAALEARLVDAPNQQPIAQATLKITAEVPLIRGQGAHLWRHEIGLFEGLLELSHLPAGAYRLEISAEGFAPWSTHQALIDRQQVDLGTIALSPLRKLSGSVVDEYRVPVEGALVTLEGSTQRAYSGADGAFELAAVDASRAVTLHASHWRRGQGSISGQGAGLVIALDAPIGGGDDAWATRLAKDDVVLRRVERGWLVSEISPDAIWYALGLRTGDAIEVVSPRRGSGTVENITRVRDGERRTLIRSQ